MENVELLKDPLLAEPIAVSALIFDPPVVLRATGVRLVEPL
jgi:hypothetical protein